MQGPGNVKALSLHADALHVEVGTGDDVDIVERLQYLKIDRADFATSNHANVDFLDRRHLTLPVCVPRLMRG